VQKAKKQDIPEPTENAQREQPHTARRRKINELRQRREIVSKKMQRETNEEQKKQLWDEWMAISQKIIDVRKESER